jgi:hypothetical protein
MGEKLKCSYCQDELDDEEIKNPPKGEDGNILCDDCYNEEYCFECCLCGDYGDIKDQHKMVVVFREAMVKPGLYKVLDESYWAASLLDDDTNDIVFPHAVQRIGDIPEGAHSDGYLLGHLCAECQEKVVNKS